MFQNYSQTYAATIATLAGFIVLILNSLKINIAQSDLELVIGSFVALVGIIWQLVHRYNKGDVTPGGKRK